MSQPESVVLRNEQTATDSRSVSASIDSEGDFVIEGQDIGKGVDSLYSYREYEWRLTVAAVDTPRLLAALGNANNLLDAVKQRFSENHVSELQPFLDEHSVPYTFWNRIGD